MSDLSPKNDRGKMIHIRLDDNTHRNLKVYAARNELSIQQIVEKLIQQKVIQTPKEKKL